VLLGAVCVAVAVAFEVDAAPAGVVPPAAVLAAVAASLLPWLTGPSLPPWPVRIVVVLFWAPDWSADPFEPAPCVAALGVLGTVPTETS
jgi:hypothetical protein